MRRLCLRLHFVESCWRRRCGEAKLGELEQGLDAVVLGFLSRRCSCACLRRTGWRRRAALQRPVMIFGPAR